MSLKKAFTKLGLLEEDAVPVAKTPQRTQTAQVAAPTPTPVVDDSIAKALEQSLQDNKLSGFDYLKFVAATEEMKVYNTPEETRYKMAFSTAKQLGLDRDSLIKSGEHYLSVLKQDDVEFKSECAQHEKKEITAKETKLAELETKITSLTEQANKAKEDHAALTEEVQEKKTSLESRRTAFESTLQSFVDTIEANIAKITKYLS